MEELSKYYIPEEEKKYYIQKFAPELPTLRAKAEISQEELAIVIGTSRQTYGAIERRSRRMSWNTYLSLMWFYDYNRKTHKLLRSLEAFPHELIKRFNDGDEPQDFELGLLFRADKRNIIESLDDQAIATIKTILMVEYSRCNNISGDAVLRFFDGENPDRKEATEEDKQTMLAINNIRRRSENE